MAPAADVALPNAMRSAVLVPPFSSSTDRLEVVALGLSTMPLVASVDVSEPLPFTSNGFQRPLLDVLPRFSAPLIVRLPPDTKPDAEELDVPMSTWPVTVAVPPATIKPAVVEEAVGGV